AGPRADDQPRADERRALAHARKPVADGLRRQPRAVALARVADRAAAAVTTAHAALSVVSALDALPAGEAAAVVGDGQADAAAGEGQGHLDLLCGGVFADVGERFRGDAEQFFFGRRRQ